jgi:hypothetical protein
VLQAVSLSKGERLHFLRFAGPGHFYSPLPDIADIRKLSKSLFDTSIASLPGIDLNVDVQLDLVRRFGAFMDEMPFVAASTGLRYRLDNSYFSYGDVASLYGMMRVFRPNRIIEIGSGYSSAAMLDISDAHFDGKIEFDFIEPYPDRLNSLLRTSDRERCRIRESQVQDVDAPIFDQLAAGDILFVDSSHVARIGSDVLRIVFDILPKLSPGVIVHFHDIHWPFEYPEMWIEGGRAWNEAYLVRAFLQFNSAFEILFFNSYLELHHRDLLAKFCPLMLKTPSARQTPSNGSLWIRRKG